MAKNLSIIIRNFNDEEGFINNINTILEQSYKDLEIVCVDDGSSELNGEFIKDILNRYENVKFISCNETKGSAYLRNLAIDSCSGEYIISIDNDIILEDDLIEKAVNVLEQNLDVGIVHPKRLKEEILNFDKKFHIQ